MITINFATSVDVSTDIVNMSFACYPGYFSANYLTSPCLPCPVGHYAPQAGATACTACPPQTTTLGTMADSLNDCLFCQPGVCQHGQCSVQPGSFELSCACSIGYGGASCDVNIIHIAAGAVFGALVLVALITFIVFRVRKKMRTFETDLSLREKLLSSANLELEVGCLCCVLCCAAYCAVLCACLCVRSMSFCHMRRCSEMIWSAVFVLH